MVNLETSIKQKHKWQGVFVYLIDIQEEDREIE